MAPRAKQMTHEFVTLTAEEAEGWLGKNLVNRPKRDTKIQQFARDMKNGNWNFCQDAITFDVNGKLINGQHRLNAQVLSGTTQTWSVIRNAPAESQNTMDSGIGRTAADVLHFKGEANAQLMAAIARFAHQLKHNAMSNSRISVSHEEIRTMVEEHQDLRRSTEMATWAKHKPSMTPIRPSVLGAAHWWIMQTNGMYEADRFMIRVATLQNERDGSPVLALARRANEIKRLSQRVHQRDLFAMCIKAYNYDVQGVDKTKIQTISKAGEYTIPDVMMTKRDFSQSEDPVDELLTKVLGPDHADMPIDEQEVKEREAAKANA